MDQSPIPEAGLAVLVIAALVSLAIFILTLVIWINIFKKAGYSGLMGCLMFVPIVQLVMLLILAFSEWPIERELKSLRR